MAVLLPALNALTPEAFVKRARVIRALSPPWVQIDVADGVLGAPKNFADPLIARQELSGVRLDVHLMVRELSPLILEPWLKAEPARLTVHVESAGDLRPVLKSFRKRGIERGLALGPETPVDYVFKYLDVADLLLFVAVPPGRSGQAFDERTFERIRTVRQQVAAVPLGVDGGLTSAQISPLVASGVTVFVVGSAISDAPDPRSAYAALLRLVSGS